MSRVIDEHRAYLADTVRVSAFDTALREIVKPGDIVIDLAAGTGILGLLACRAGARHVYSIDAGSIVGAARDIAAANGLADRITFVREVSTRTTLPERGDVLVTDQIGGIGIEAGLVEFVADAKRRLLKPDARVIPAAVSVYAAPIEAPEQAAAIEFWKRPVLGLTFESLWRSAASTGYPVHLDASQLLADAAPIAALPIRDEAARVSGAVEATATRAGTLHGVGCWFAARLSPSVTMTNAPDASARINRRQAFFPIGDACPVEAGDSIRIACSMLPTVRIVSWAVTVVRAPSGERRHYTGSTFHGMLISSEDMARTDPGLRPELTPAGRGRRTVLDLCDGRRDLASIEREVLARHPDLFASAAEAAAFVAEVVSRYASAS